MLRYINCYVPLICNNAPAGEGRLLREKRAGFLLSHRPRTAGVLFCFKFAQK